MPVTVHADAWQGCAGHVKGRGEGRRGGNQTAGKKINKKKQVNNGKPSIDVLISFISSFKTKGESRKTEQWGTREGRHSPMGWQRHR